MITFCSHCSLLFTESNYSLHLTSLNHRHTGNKGLKYHSDKCYREDIDSVIYHLNLAKKAKGVKVLPPTTSLVPIGKLTKAQTDNNSCEKSKGIGLQIKINSGSSKNTSPSIFPNGGSTGGQTTLVPSPMQISKPVVKKQSRTQN